MGKMICMFFMLIFFSEFVLAKKYIGGDQVERWMVDVNGDGKKDTISAYFFQEMVHTIRFEVNGERCEIFPTKGFKPKSLINTSSLCSHLYQKENLAKIPLIDSLTNYKTIPEKAPIPAHMDWLLQAHQSYQKIQSNQILVATKTQNEAYGYFVVQYLGVGFSSKLYDAQNKYLWGAIPSLNLTGTNQSTIGYEGESLTKAIDLRTYDLNPKYPKIVDSIPGTNLLVSGHSVMVLTTDEAGDKSVYVVFVSDGYLWKNVQDLKYTSILKAQFVGDFIFILGDAGEMMTNYLYIVDWKNGYTYMVNPSLYVPKDEDYKRYVMDFEVMEDEVLMLLKTAPSYDDLTERFFDWKKVVKEAKTYTF